VLSDGRLDNPPDVLECYMILAVETSNDALLNNF